MSREETVINALTKHVEIKIDLNLHIEICLKMLSKGIAVFSRCRSDKNRCGVYSCLSH